MKLKQQYNLAQLADLLGYDLYLPAVVNCNASAAGNVDASRIVIDGIATIEAAVQSDITFLANPAYAKHLAKSNAGAVILGKTDVANCPLPALVTANPRLALAKILELCSETKDIVSAVHSSCVIGENCNIAADVQIGPNCVIGDGVTLESRVVIGANTVIGDDCVLQQGSCLKANVTLYDKVILGQNTTIHSSSVIGCDGFGYANDAGKWVKIPHLGQVVIGNNVEIGSNTSVDRGVIEDTVIADGVIIDNLVQIGHNVKIGENTAIAGCVAVAGSTSIGRNCLIGGGVLIAGHLIIGDQVTVTGSSNVNRSLKTGIYSSGFPAKENAKWQRNVARFNYLDSMAKRLQLLEKSLQT